MPAASVVGQLALGIGLLFVRPLTADVDNYALDRVSPRPDHPQLQIQPVQLARRVRLDREFGVALVRQLTC